MFEPEKLRLKYYKYILDNMYWYSSDDIYNYKYDDEEYYCQLLCDYIEKYISNALKIELGVKFSTTLFDTSDKEHANLLKNFMGCLKEDIPKNYSAYLSLYTHIRNL